jgi:6-pyruvoyl-tetrahydropterin synthase
MTKEVYISIEGGKIVNKTTFQKALWELKDGRYLVKIEPKKKRTNGQNRYIHGVLFPELKNAFNEAGWDEIRTMEMAKEIAKRRFLTTQIVNEKTGEVMEFVKETSQLSTLEMNVFIDDVIKFAAENLNYQIMYPNEQASLYE